jgi:O-antigen ligase
MWWRKLDFSAVPVVCVAAIVAGMLLDPARAMPSIAMLILSVYVLTVYPLRNFSLFFRDRILIAFVLFFFTYVLSGLNSTEDRDFLLERIRLKLPFLALPIALIVLKDKITRRRFQLLLALFFVIAVVASAEITFRFAVNYKNILLTYEHGKVVETPFSHTRYSLMVAFACLTGFYLFQQRFYLRYPVERWLILAASLFLVFFLHLLAVRSGLFAFYLCGIYLFFYFIFRKKNARASIGMGLMMLMLPVLAYLLIPSVKAKVNYMRYDLEHFFLLKEASSYSDAGRIVSIQKGLEIFSENWLTGVGIGDLRKEMHRKLAAAPEKPNYLLLPHNQFVYVAAGTGLFGLLVFAAAVFLPVLNRNNRRQWLFACFQIIVISSFLTEATLEEQMGTAFYLTFTLWMYLHFNEEGINEV